MPKPVTPLLSVDCVLFDAAMRLLLVRRKYPPYEGEFALPGGFVEVGETVEAACKRELMEETGVRAGKLRLIGVYSDPRRDPRCHNCSVAFLTRIRTAKATAGDDAADAVWIADWRRIPLAFDHRKILNDGLALVRKESAPRA